MTVSRRLAYGFLALFIFFGLITPSWRYGPFAWLPLWSAEKVAGAPLALGVLNLLPLLAGVAWGVSVWAQPRPFRYGRRAVALPLALLTLWGVSTLPPLTPRHIFIGVGALGIAWLVYLLGVNEGARLERPLILSLAAIVVVQSGVALGQFFAQSDLGWAAMGELPLNPAFSGVTVLFARGERWLRAYGLTAHPNLLGALLAVLLLWLLPRYGRLRGAAAWLLGGALALGWAGLYLSFSRSAWLGTLVGLAVWGVGSWRDVWAWWRGGRQTAVLLRWGLPLLPALLLLAGYGDLALSRFMALETPLEARSLAERASDSQIAMQLISDHPWRGVGLGNYTDAAAEIVSPARRVHNVPLLVTAELGILGGLLWAWLAIAPLWLAWRRRVPAAALGLWLAGLTMAQFDTMVWISSNWQTAILFGLLCTAVAAPLPHEDL